MNRIKEIDFARGLMVILMIAYHVFLTLMPSGTQPESAVYLTKISTSVFPLMVGVLIGFFPDVKTYRDRVSKAIKIILIFLVLNAFRLLIDRSSSFNSNTAADIFLAGSQTQVSFEILLPIAYIMIFSPLFIRRTESWLGAGIIILFVLDIYRINLYNFAGVIAGIAGIWLGKSLNKRRTGSFDSPSGLAQDDSKSLLYLLLITLIANICVSIFYNLDFWTLNIINAFIAFRLAYSAANRWKVLNGKLDLLSTHSLFIYIFHVLLLKIIAIKYSQMITDNFFIALIYIVVYTGFNWLLVFFIDKSLEKNSWGKKVYKFLLS